LGRHCYSPLSLFPYQLLAPISFGQVIRRAVALLRTTAILSGAYFCRDLHLTNGTIFHIEINCDEPPGGWPTRQPISLPDETILIEVDKGSPTRQRHPPTAQVIFVCSLLQANIICVGHVTAGEISRG
jgi:hypothetical protein